MIKATGRFLADVIVSCAILFALANAAYYGIPLLDSHRAIGAQVAAVDHGLGHEVER